MIIGFTGGMGVGKSTAVKILTAALYRDYTQRPGTLIKFAQPLYDMQEFIYDRISGVYQRPATFVKDRKLLQWIGTEWGRGMSPTLWVDIWKSDAEIALAKGYTVIVDDVRFDNEAQAIKDMGGTIISVTSKHAPVRIDTRAGILGHTSEKGIDSKFVDKHVANDLDYECYVKELERVFQSLGIK